MAKKEHPNFWRHFGAYALGGIFIAGGVVGGVVFPPLAPFSAKLVLAGSGLLGLAGTKVIEKREVDSTEEDTKP